MVKHVERFDMRKAVTRKWYKHIIRLFHTFLCNSPNYYPRGAVDDPMHCCPRLKPNGNSVSGHSQHRGGDSFDCCTERYEIL